jgi:hypothetical protein
MSNLVEEAQHLIEAMPDFARIWKVPERERDQFASRFYAMAQLQTS